MPSLLSIFDASLVEISEQLWLLSTSSSAHCYLTSNDWHPSFHVMRSIETNLILFLTLEGERIPKSRKLKFVLTVVGNKFSLARTRTLSLYPPGKTRSLSLSLFGPLRHTLSLSLSLLIDRSIKVTILRSCCLLVFHFCKLLFRLRFVFQISRQNFVWSFAAKRMDRFISSTCFKSWK